MLVLLGRRRHRQPASDASKCTCVAWLGLGVATLLKLEDDDGFPSDARAFEDLIDQLGVKAVAVHVATRLPHVLNKASQTQPEDSSQTMTPNHRPHKPSSKSKLYPLRPNSLKRKLDLERAYVSHAARLQQPGLEDLSPTSSSPALNPTLSP